jgi:hypothetical protein
MVMPSATFIVLFQMSDGFMDRWPCLFRLDGGAKACRWNHEDHSGDPNPL